MEIIEQDDLAIALVDQREAENKAWEASGAAIDVVRLTDSEAIDDATLTRLGFMARPQWVNWCAALRSSEEEFEAALSGTERRNIRLGRRFIEDARMRVEVREGLTEGLVDDFLTVYDEQIARMPRGKNFARRWRDRLLAGSDEHVSACVYADETMVAGSLWWMRQEQSVLQMRFSAASRDARSNRVLRAAYLEAFRFARRSGVAFASLGNDPSLFGHVVQPGLFNFKSRLGFTVVPSQVLDPRLAGEFADRFLSLRSLSDPSLVVTWGRHRGRPPSWPEAAQGSGHDLLLLSGSPDASALAGFRTDSFRETGLVNVP